MSEKYPLNETLSPIDREGRNRLNDNWTRIMAYFDHVQLQIKALAGGHEVDELIARLEQAAENAKNANSTMESAVEDFNNAMQQLQEVVSDAITATSNATSAAQSANDKVVEATQLLSTLKTLQEELQQLQTTLTQVIGSAQIATQDAIDATTAADTAAVNATTAANKANDATTAANNAAATIAGWGTAIEWTNGTYNKNNVVTRNGNTYQARKDKVSSTPPNPAVTNADWIVLAVRGVDGKGSVSTVNGKSPDPNGNVLLEIGKDINTNANIDNNISINALPDSYPVGITITKPTISATNDIYVGWRDAIYSKFGLTSTSIPINIVIETFKSNKTTTSLHQLIKVYNNVSGVDIGKLVFTAYRNSQTNVWGELVITLPTFVGDGNPEGKVRAWLGTTYYDNTNKKYYYRKNTTAANGSTGWVEQSADADLTEVNQEIANIKQTVTDNKTEVTEHLGHIASKDKLGHVKVGNNLTIDKDGTLNAINEEKIEYKNAISPNESLFSFTKVITISSISQFGDASSVYPKWISWINEIIGVDISSVNLTVVTYKNAGIQEISIRQNASSHEAKYPGIFAKIQKTIGSDSTNVSPLITFPFYVNSGSPEGVIYATAFSQCFDKIGKKLYIKSSPLNNSPSNTGWALV